MELAKIMG